MVMFEDHKEIQVLFNGKWLSDDISIINVPSSRKIDEEIELAAKEAWRGKVRQAELSGSKIWDSNIFRYENVKINENKLVIYISEIPFSVRLGMNECTEKIKKLGHEYAPYGMFNSCLVETNDLKFVFIQKSKSYFSEKKNSWVGGVYSKTETEIKSGTDLFFSTTQELIEELGICADDIKNIQLTTGYQTKNWNICFLFYITLKISSDELKKEFSKKSDVEASNVLLISKLEINECKDLFDDKDKIKFAFFNNL